MLKKLWAFLTNGKVVWLQDSDGELTRSIAYTCGAGKMISTRLVFYRKAVLEADGTVSFPVYVKKWWFE